MHDHKASKLATPKIRTLPPDLSGPLVAQILNFWRHSLGEVYTLPRHIWRICWIWRDALRDLAAHATLYFRLSFYNRYVVIINVYDLLSARVLREAQEAGPANAFERSSFQFQQNSAEFRLRRRQQL